MRLCNFPIILLLFVTGTQKKERDEVQLRQSTEEQLRILTQQLTQAEFKDDLSSFLRYYDEDIISMPEYQLTLEGLGAIESFYKEIFNRQNIKTFQRVPSEFIHLDSTVVEIGTIRKEYFDKGELPLKNVEQNLSSQRFIRVHKSFIVSIPKIEAIENNEILIQSHLIPISRHYRDHVMNRVVNDNLWKK